MRLHAEDVVRFGAVRVVVKPGVCQGILVEHVHEVVLA
jgi:hypothetical protein